MVLLLFNNVIYVFLLLWICILIVCLCIATLTEVFPCFFLSCKANARVKPAKREHGPHSSQFLCRSVYCLCVYVYCTVLLPPGGYPIAVNKYITSSSFLTPTFLLAQAIFEPNLLPYGYPNIVKFSHSAIYLPMKMEQTECSETSAYKIQTPGNYPEEII